MTANIDNRITPTDDPDTDDSTSSGISQTSSGSTSNLNILVVFDDLMRKINRRNNLHKDMQGAIPHFTEELKNVLLKYGEVSRDNEKLTALLDLKVQEISDIEIRLNRARHLLDEEKKKSKKVFNENEALKDKLNQVAEFILGNDHVKISPEVKEKLSFLNENDFDYRKGKNLSAIHEINSTGSLLSDFSVSRSEDDLEPSISVREWKKHKASDENDTEPALKKRRSSSSKTVEIGTADTVRATTTLVIENKGPVTATAVIESIPTPKHGAIPEIFITPDATDSPVPSAPPSNLILKSWDQINTPNKYPTLKPDVRYHSLQQRITISTDNCVVCHKKISFGKMVSKCKECRVVAHIECKTNLPLPCVPVINTPNHKKILGIISDYAPTTPPMVPALIIHCINEIELRGLNELGLYRISAAEKEVKSLQEKFLKGRTVSNLADIDIHVICGCVKDFLRSLTQPITTYPLRNEFVRAVESRDNVVPALYQCISKLPLANRDTLAYIILHLQKVSQSPDCKMPVENLAKVFGPTIVGYSSDNPNPNNLLAETKQQIIIMEQLIRLPSDYWSSMLNVIAQYPGRRIQQTPSTDSLFKSDTQMFTPRSKRNVNRKIFATPPAFKY